MINDREMQNILIFSTAYHPHIGGAEVAIAEITKRLARDYRFVLITYRFRSSDLRREIINGVEVHRLGFGTALDRLFLFPILAFFHGLKLIKQKKINLLWAVMVSYAGIGAYLVKFIKPKIPLLLTLQEGDPEEHLQFGKLGMLGFWWKRLVYKADYIQAISAYLADYALKQGATSKIAIVPNGVDLRHFSKKLDSQTVQKHKKFFGFADSDKVIITVSRLVEKNAVDIIIRALSRLENNYKLLIAGRGEKENDLKILARNLTLEGRVIFLGEIAHKELPIFLQVADIFVRPSRSEGLGNSFLEAMAAGLPVIGTEVGGIPDFLEDGETGLFTKVDDHKDVARQIKRACEDHALHKNMVDKGRKLVQDGYSWDSVSEQMRTIFGELL